MCFLIESFCSSCRPRYCGESSFYISSPTYLIFTLFSTLYLLENVMYTVLFVLSFSFHGLQYVHRLRRIVLTLACALYMFALVDQSMRVWEVLHNVIDVQQSELPCSIHCFRYSLALLGCVTFSCTPHSNMIRSGLTCREGWYTTIKLAGDPW